MADAVEFSSIKEEQLPPNENKIIISKPKKECLLKNIANSPDRESEESEFSDTSHNENYAGNIPVCPDPEDSDGKLYSVLETLTDTELKTASYSETEDWDEELECGPYNADDFDCGSVQEDNIFASYSWHLYYSPACHHAAPLAFTPPVRVTEFGQFDDAADEVDPGES